MSQHGPEIEQTSYPIPEYSYRTIVDDPLIYKATTRMPSDEVIKELENLPPLIASEIRGCITEIYSHVTEREPPEGKWHFCHTTAQTICLEVTMQIKIKGKDHAKKGAVTFNRIQKTLEEIEQRRNLVNSQLRIKDSLEEVEQQRAERHHRILTLFQNILIVHRNALVRPLKAVSSETKAHFLQHMQLNVDALQIIPLTSQVAEQVAASFPTTPSPKKTKRTPKKLSEKDKESIARLTPTSSRKRLFAEEPEKKSVIIVDEDTDPSKKEDKVLDRLQAFLDMDEDAYSSEEEQKPPRAAAGFWASDSEDDFFDEGSKAGENVEDIFDEDDVWCGKEGGSSSDDELAAEVDALAFNPSLVFSMLSKDPDHSAIVCGSTNKVKNKIK